MRNRISRGRGGGRERGERSPPIFTILFFSDISLINRKSNKQVSHFLLKDITKVISKGRDRIVEIESSRLLSCECK